MNPLKKALDWVQTTSPFMLLAAMFGLIAISLTFIAYLIPEELFVGAFAFVGVYLILVASRITQLWQFGVEVHHLFTICFALTFGPLPAIALTIASSITNMYAAMHVENPILVHTLPGPLQQSFELLIVATLAGFIGQLAPGFALANLIIFGTVLTAIGVGIEKVLCHMLCGIEIGRLIVAWIVNIIVVYNLFFMFGHRVLLWMQAI